MKVTARGWSRNMGSKNITEADLSDVSVSRDPDRRISFNTDPTIFRTSAGVNIDWGKHVNLSGRYRWEVELTTDDIVRLFRLKMGSELDVELLEQHGFTVSEDLKKKILGSIKLADLTLGDLANLGVSAPSDQTLPNSAPTISPFRRRL